MTLMQNKYKSSDQYLFLMPKGRSFLPTSVAGFMHAKSLKSACRVMGSTSLQITTKVKQ